MDSFTIIALTIITLRRTALRALLNYLAAQHVAREERHGALLLTLPTLTDTVEGLEWRLNMGLDRCARADAHIDAAARLYDLRCEIRGLEYEMARIDRIGARLHERLAA